MHLGGDFSLRETASAPDKAQLADLSGVALLNSNAGKHGETMAKIK